MHVLDYFFIAQIQKINIGMGYPAVSSVHNDKVCVCVWGGGGGGGGGGL